MIKDRYDRQVKLAGFGKDAQQKLAVAKVLVVGAGGLGVPVLQYLTGMGVGTIGIIDGDIIKADNLHRQVLYSEEDIGLLKAEVAMEKLFKLNSKVKFKSHLHFLNTKDALSTISEYNFVIDASDNFGTRYLINDACVILNKPFVYGAVQQFEGHVSVFNYQGGPTYRCVYPHPPAENEIPNCDTAGVLGIAPGIIGCQQALQAVKVITGIGDNLSGYLQVFDLLRDEQYKIKLKVNAQNKFIKTLQPTYDTPHCESSSTIDVHELYKMHEGGTPFELIDVREPKEFTAEHLSFSRNVPLVNVKAYFSNRQIDVPLILICEIGGRSARAAEIIKQIHPGSQVQNVEGGLESWFDEFDEQFIVYPETSVSK
ncbi:HesA/MoeB/ThiF family protein [Mucilaginibacter ginkgonis]|uniref:Molybdopterin-synthase adenylyltransferase n=1 Tax=Mucilaginibacter ginkgonis TaxID=2682091 RepID=A0A6I4I2L2_9SPHI|nr:HesA/MoeB/ThiF family protein [Mucilaginibacter ginkgonis]QQL50734.1 HesA/MoeB/ThiF family protein [Mucilaginibacter ginkgonis]